MWRQMGTVLRTRRCWRKSVGKAESHGNDDKGESARTVPTVSRDEGDVPVAERAAKTLPHRKYVGGGYLEQRVFKMPPSPDRAKLRSKTYPGIAKAMAEQWAGKDVIHQISIEDLREEK